jgi:uroporphyrinogen-III synthase
MSEEPGARPLTGRRIALLETREAERLGAMLREHGAEIVGCPMVAIVDAADPAPVRAWLERCIAAPPDDLLLLTGEGLYRLHGAAQRAGIDAAFVAAIAQARTITRGPKPARALRMLGLQPQLRAAQPTTDGIIALLSGLELSGRRVGVQLYPGAGSRLVDFVAEAGAVADPVTPYEYAAGAADAAIAALIERIAAGDIDAIAFTSAPQVRRLFEVAEASHSTDQLETGLRHTAIAAIGPVVEEELRRHALRATIMPADSYFMKPLVSAIVAGLGEGVAPATPG